jgi:hypothetical protein
MDDFSYVVGLASEDDDSVLIGRGTTIVKIPADHWKSHVAAATERISARLAFMSEEHHLVRRFVVTQIARRVKPVTAAQITRQLKLPQDRVQQILGELESRLFFLARNSEGAVSWAYPFTVDHTPHTVIRPSRGAARAA